jgi:hypothetical protein
MKKSLLIAGISCICMLIPASASFAADWSPKLGQKFVAKVIGKQGTATKPGSVGTYFHPFHDVGSAGGPTNIGNKNSGALMHPTFSTVLAHILMPKEVTLSGKGFKFCTFTPAEVSDPDLCPEGSELGKGSGAGYARLPNAAAGTFTLQPQLVVRVFLTGEKEISLWTYNPTTKENIIVGSIGNATGVHKKKFKTDITFHIPKGLIMPAPGLASQLTSFEATVDAKKNAAGKPLVALTKCPKNKTLVFGYYSLYNIGLDTKVSPKISVDGFQFSINQTGDVVESKVKCK